MHIIKFGYDVAELQEEVSSIGLHRIADGSGSSHFGGPEGWIHGLHNARIELIKYPWISLAIAYLRNNVSVGDVEQVMVNRLEAGAEFGRHRDGLPDNARFHLPVITHESAYWWDELNGTIHMKQGHWYGPMPYCGILHAVGNPSEIDRIHLVVDFKRKGKN